MGKASSLQEDAKRIADSYDAPKKHTGRKSKLTPAVQKTIVGHIRAGNYIEVAARAAGITDRTFYLWMEKGEASKSGIYYQFFQAIKDAEADAEAEMVASIKRHGLTNWQATMTLLERRHPERWAKLVRNEHTGKDGGPIAIKGYIGFSPDDWDEDAEND